MAFNGTLKLIHSCHPDILCIQQRLRLMVKLMLMCVRLCDGEAEMRLMMLSCELVGDI